MDGQTNNPTGETAAVKHQAIFWAAAAAAILIDQLTKLRVEARFAIGESIYPVPGLEEILRLIHVTNTGAAWGTFEGYGWVFSIIAFLVAGYLLLVNYRLPGAYPLFRLIVGVIAGGALGNAIDRIRLGHVTDFVDFNFRPLVSGTFLDRPFLDIAIFNWADVFIIGGVLVLGVLMWTDHLPEEPAVDTPVAPPAPRPFSRPTSLKGYDPALQPPEIPPAEEKRWRQARTAVLVSGLIVVSLSIWFVSWGISSRANRRSHRR